MSQENKEIAQEPGPSFADKIFAVTQEVSYLQKKGENKLQNYKFLQESDVKEAIRTSFLKNRLLFGSTVIFSKVEDLGLKTKSGVTQLVTQIQLECQIKDMDSKEFISFKTHGQGVDPGDKGIYKAITGAIKYGLTSNFLIPTGEDPENDSTVQGDNHLKPRRRSPAQLFEDAKEGIYRAPNIEDLKNIMTFIEQEFKGDRLKELNELATKKFDILGP